MGSFAKNDVFSDVDLNFFVHENNSKVIKNVRKMIDYFLKEYGLYLDINIINMDSMKFKVPMFDENNKILLDSNGEIVYNNHLLNDMSTTERSRLGIFLLNSMILFWSS